MQTSSNDVGLLATRAVLRIMSDPTRPVPHLSTYDRKRVGRLLRCGFTEIGIAEAMDWDLDRVIAALLAMSRG